MMKKLLLILILPLLSNGQSFEHGSFANRSERHTNTDFRKFQTNFSHDSSRDQAHLSAIATPVVGLRLDRLVEVNFSGDQLSYKRDLTYDVNGNEVLKTIYQWDTASDSFVPSQKLESIFNENGDPTLYTYYNWDTDTNGYVNYIKITFTYVENGRTILAQIWDANANSYVNNNKDVVTEDGYVETTITQSWNTDTEVYVDSYKKVITYDENNRILDTDFYSWDSETVSFLPYSRNVYTYDENEMTYLIQTLNADTGDYINISQENTTYDLNGNITLIETTAFDNDGVIAYYNQSGYAYDENGHMAYSLFPKYDSESSSFIPSFKTEYSTVLDSDTKLNRMGISYEYNNTISGLWDPFEGEAVQSFFYYTKLDPLSAEDLVDQHFSVYPNPAKDFLFIDSTSIERATIYTILGKEVLDVRGQNKLDIAPLSKGVYFINVSDGKKASTKKFIKN